MKRMLSWLLIALILLFAVPAIAEMAGGDVAVEVSSLFTYADNGNGTCTITGYNGGAGGVGVPAEIDGLTVTAIGNYAFHMGKMDTLILPDTIETIGRGAFSYCENLTSLHIPASVEKISGEAFRAYCGLTQITVDENNQYYKAIDGVLFDNFMGTLIHYPSGKMDETYVVPAGIWAIEYSAFSQNMYVENILLPESILRINNYAFEGCSALKEINLPNNLMHIGEEVFVGCGQLIASVEDPSYALDWCWANGIDYAVINDVTELSSCFTYEDNGVTTYVMSSLTKMYK